MDGANTLKKPVVNRLNLSKILLTIRENRKRLESNRPPEIETNDGSGLQIDTIVTKLINEKQIPKQIPDERCTKDTDEINSIEPEEIELEEVAVPQLKLGPNNEIILDEGSLTVTNTRTERIIKQMNSVQPKVENDDCGVSKKRIFSRVWTIDETVKFYRCLCVVGTDFTTMLEFFPDRTRNQLKLKLKFKREERNNKSIVDKVIWDNNHFEVEALRKQLEEREFAPGSKEHKKKWREMKEKWNSEHQSLKAKRRYTRTLANAKRAYDAEGLKILKRKTPKTQADVLKIVEV